MRIVPVLIASVLLSSVFLDAAPTAQAATGDVLRVFSGPCFAGNGRAVAYDGSGHLYYTVYGSTSVAVATVAGGCVTTKNPGVNLASLTWDPTRNVFWAGAYDGSGNVYTWDPNTNALSLRFNTLSSTAGDGSCCPGYIDGLAYDSATGTLWFSNDLSFWGTQTIFQLSTTGAVLKTFKVNGGNSGLAFDGIYLWLAFPMTSEIRKYAVPTTSGTTPAPLASFSTGSYEIESMSFDLDTFAPKCAVWGNGATWGANPLVAFQIPCGAAIGDAWTLSVNGLPYSVHEDGRAYAARNNTVDNSTKVVTEGPVTVKVGNDHAVSQIASRFPLFSGSARATSNLVDVDVAGVLHADAVFVRADSSGDSSTVSSNAQGFITGLSILGGPASDIAYPGPAENITLPNGEGYVSLFEVEHFGDGSITSEVRITAIHVHLKASLVAGGASDIRVAVAWTGVTATGTLRDHPPLQTAFPCITAIPRNVPACPVPA